MIKFKPNVRVVGVDSAYSEGDDMRLGIYFNTKNTVIAPKPVLDILFMFNGLFTSSDILSSSLGHKDIESKKIVDTMFEYGIISESETAEADSESRKRFLTAQKRLQDYTVHFRQVSNVNITIAMLLQKLNVTCVFYEDATISDVDSNENIYFERVDVGSAVSSVLKARQGVSNIIFKTSNEYNLNGDNHVLISSDPLNWTDSESAIVINTWNYSKSQFLDFMVFNEKDCDVSNDLKPLIEGYVCAFRSVDDIVYHILNGTVA